MTACTYVRATLGCAINQSLPANPELWTRLMGVNSQTQNDPAWRGGRAGEERVCLILICVFRGTWTLFGDAIPLLFLK